MREKTDIVVIGAGAVGLACAYFLSRAGRSVRVVDQGAVGHGSSFANCGLITPSHSAPVCSPENFKLGLAGLLDKKSPFHMKFRMDADFIAWVNRYSVQATEQRARQVMAAKTRILRASRTLTEKLIAAEKLQCQWSASGLLSVYLDGDSFAKGKEDAENLRRLGVGIEILDSVEVNEREPALLSDVCGGILYLDDAMLRPDQFCEELARVCKEKGVVIDEKCEVKAINHESGAVDSVYTSRGLFKTDAVVVAAGAWSRALLKPLKIKLPIEPGKGYSLTTARPDPCPKQPLLLEERRIAVTPWGTSYRLGGTMEFAGFDASLNRERLDALIEGAAEYLMEAIPPGKPKEWCGFRPMTPDDLPIIGSAGEPDNLWLACGHNMLGMSMAASTGRLIAELITGHKPHIDPGAYSPTRFSEQPSNPAVAGWRKLRRKYQEMRAGK